MIAGCDTWNEAVEAVDVFVRVTQTRPTAVIFGGIATPTQDDNSDILSSREIQQRVLDLLDESQEG